MKDGCDERPSHIKTCRRRILSAIENLRIFGMFSELQTFEKKNP